jgi:hypothetical protein
LLEAFGGHQVTPRFDNGKVGRRDRQDSKGSCDEMEDWMPINGQKRDSDQKAQYPEKIAIYLFLSARFSCCTVVCQQPKYAT